MKKLVLTIATILFIGLIAFAYENKKRTPNDNNVHFQKVNGCGDSNPVLKPQHQDLPKELVYDIRSVNFRPVKKEQLKNARSIRDLISDYPVNWISTYVSVEISAICNGKTMKVISPNDILSVEQKNMMNAMDVGTDVMIDVNYTYKTPVTKTIEKNTMHVAMTLVPELEAEYVGGHEQMVSYLKEHIDRFSKTTPEKLQQVTIRFTVNEEGKVTNSKISNATGYDETYIVLMDAIYKMPHWKPAENAEGKKVKQEFEFTVGRAGC